MAPINAAMIRQMESDRDMGSKVEISMMFFPIVLATAVPKRKGPMNSQTAAMARALLGDRAPVVMMVATTLAAS